MRASLLFGVMHLHVHYACIFFSLNDTLRVEFAELSSENYDLKVLLQQKESSEHNLSQTIEQLREEVSWLEYNKNITGKIYRVRR